MISQLLTKNKGLPHVTKEKGMIQQHERKAVTLRKWLGTRLQSTGVRNWTWSRGGHWGTGFLLSLLNKPADSGMVFCRKKRVTRLPSLQTARHGGLQMSQSSIHKV